LAEVLVTIDDLAALMEILSRHNDSKKVIVGFDAGYFTEAQDLPTLSNMEMQTFRVQNSKIMVALTPWTAEAVGDPQEAKAVYSWAQLRPAPRRPLELNNIVSYIVFLLLGVSAFLSFMIILPAILKRSVSALNYTVSSLLMAALIVAIISMWRSDLKDNPSYAMIVPSSLSGYRQSLSSQTYPRRSWIVAIISAIIAALAVAAAIWIKVTS
jgi:hypothetical protein